MIWVKLMRGFEMAMKVGLGMGIGKGIARHSGQVARKGKAGATVREIVQTTNARTIPAAVPAGIDWLVAMPRPGCERMLAHDASRHGMAACLPLERVLISSRRFGTTAIERPLFRGYVFIAVPSARQGYAAIAKLDGMGALLMRQGLSDWPEPVTVKGAVIEAINRAEIEGWFDQVETRALAAKAARKIRHVKGAKVKMMEGPFAGLLASVKGHKGDGRISLLIEVGGRTWPLDVAVDQIEAA